MNSLEQCEKSGQTMRVPFVLSQHDGLWAAHQADVAALDVVAAVVAAGEGEDEGEGEEWGFLG